MAKKLDTHPLYKKNFYTWQSVEDAVEGPSCVKSKNILYLPMPVGFEEDETSYSSTSSPQRTRKFDAIDKILIENAPHYHPNAAYMGYLHRARFPEMTIQTLRGLIGVATRVDASINLPNKIKYLEKEATKRGQDIYELFSVCLSEVLIGGRVVLILDTDVESNRLCIVPYSSKQFINWLENERTGDIELAVFSEKMHEIDPNEEGKIVENEYVTVHEMGKVGEDKDDEGKKPYHIVKKKEKDEAEFEIFTPSLQGRKFEELAIVCIGSIENSCTPGPVPLAPVSDIAYSIYRKDADLANAQYMTCNPMLVVSGADDKVPVAIGSTVALVLANPEAKAAFTQTDTSALNHVSKNIQELREEAASFGASFMGPTKRGVESADTTSMRQVAQGSTLIGCVENISKGIEEILKIAARISGAKDDVVEFSASTDFAERILTPDILKALVTLWQSSAYSLESLLTVVGDAGFIMDDDIAKELARIAAEAPKFVEVDEEESSDGEESDEDDEDETDDEEDEELEDG